MSGQDLIDYICKELEAKNVRLYDSAIVAELRRMSKAELERIISE